MDRMSNAKLNCFVLVPKIENMVKKKKKQDKDIMYY